MRSRLRDNGSLKRYLPGSETPNLKPEEFECGLSSSYLNPKRTAIGVVALTSLWVTTCAVGTQSNKFAISVFKELCGKNKLIKKLPDWCEETSGLKSLQEVFSLFSDN